LLVVDDEPSLLTVMDQYLRRLGYDVVACRTGQEAWHEFHADPLAYVLVLADATLPEMSATELLQKMLDLNPKVAMLICSGYPFDMASLDPALRERVGFLQKPFTPRMLAGAVEKLLALKHG
jgi:DNA-binding NtrC family response regulator